MSASARRTDHRAQALIATVLLVGALGLGIALLPEPQPVPATGAVNTAPAGKQNQPPAPEQRHAREAREQEIAIRFRQAVAMLHAGEYDYALKALHRVLDLSPRMPEAHVNMGYALFGLGQYPAARDFFTSAIDLRPEQANAYYGLAISLEQLGDLAGALGAMRTYLHRGKADSRYRRRAEAAVWEWEAALQKQRAAAAE